MAFIAKDLVESKFVPCIQLEEVQNFFFYEAQLKQVKEFHLMIKAKMDNYNAIEEFIKFNHNYQLLQIIKLDITAGLQSTLIGFMVIGILLLCRLK